MRCVCGNDHDAARFHLARFVSDRDGGAAFKRECDLDVRVRMQRWALPGLRIDDVGRERRTLVFADELVRHSNKRQLLEADEAHMPLCICQEHRKARMAVLRTGWPRPKEKP
jgi:hypothetical protein